MEEKMISINNLEVNYKIAGSGPVILILHGWGGSSDSWIKVIEMLADKGYRVVCPDFPGFGKSHAPVKPWDVTNYKEWLLGFVQSQGLDEFILLGHSFGGRVAIKFSVKYPERVKTLILCDSAGLKSKPGFKNRIISHMAYIGNIVFSPRLLTRFKNGARNIFYSFLRNKDYVKANGVMKESIKKVIDEDLFPYLSQIKIKTLIVWGERDKMVPVKQSYILKEQIKGSVLELLPDVGHSPHLEVPGKLFKIIVSFLTD